MVTGLKVPPWNFFLARILFWLLDPIFFYFSIMKNFLRFFFSRIIMVFILKLDFWGRGRSAYGVPSETRFLAASEPYIFLSFAIKNAQKFLYLMR